MCTEKLSLLYQQYFTLKFKYLRKYFVSLHYKCYLHFCLFSKYGSTFTEIYCILIHPTENENISMSKRLPVPGSIFIIPLLLECQDWVFFTFFHFFFPWKSSFALPQGKNEGKRETDLKYATFMPLSVSKLNKQFLYTA